MDKQLFESAGEGNLQVLKSLIAQGANIEYIDDYVSQVIFYLSTVLMLNKQY